MVQIKISDGILEGEKIQNKYGGSFYSFKSIPYAKPPLGDLRFKAPQPVEPWNGIRNAKNSAPESYQCDSFFTKKIFGQEDCLYLNVYTPDLEPNKCFPVMVWIHGGGFSSGSGNDDMYGPEFIVNKDVILVTINYRLGALGFLCLDTEEIPGNAGMKDQIAALRWVQNNIENFGGDPSKVTIFGESAGAASVSCHLISPMSVGLFKRAILQSGSITNSWAICQKPRDRALILAKKLGCFTENDEELTKFFKSLPVESLIQIKLPITASENILERIHLYFAIVDEKQFGNNERYFYESSRTPNIHRGVDVIIGYVEHEGVIGLKTDKDMSEILDQANFYPECFVPNSFTFKTTAMEQLEMGNRIKKYYFHDDIISIENLEQLVNFLTVDLFVYGIIVFARLIARSKKNKVYLYKFSCKSKRNIFTKIFGADHVLNNKTFVCHADDLGYLFPMKVFFEDIDTNTKEYKMIQTVTKLWTDFAKFGCPTPDKSCGIEWLPYTLEKQNYVNIDEKVTACEEPEKEEIIFWDKIHAHHFPDYAFYLPE
ncbi:juvenile hormone esterase-like [Vanessa cardui]|uniref:juvenile hormone esterase-like n=1 Tax=Vanessa cardui TaxID=171605 RepID=UPI001F13D358|nr:juvenile hormone esterase-like [Vanessa cardui]